MLQSDEEMEDACTDDRSESGQSESSQSESSQSESSQSESSDELDEPGPKRIRLESAVDDFQCGSGGADLATVCTQTQLTGQSYYICKAAVRRSEGLATPLACCGEPVIVADAAVQASEDRHPHYHKATQMPEMSYNPYTNKNIVRQCADFSTTVEIHRVKSESTGEDSKELVATAIAMATQTEFIGISQQHKATQHPDKDYPDPGHPPAATPSLYLPDQQALSSNQLAASQLASNQLAASQLMSNQLVASQLASNQLAASQLASNQLAANQQQLYAQQYGYSYIDPTTGLCMLPVQQQTQTWPYLQYQQYPGYDQM